MNKTQSTSMSIPKEEASNLLPLLLSNLTGKGWEMPKDGFDIGNSSKNIYIAIANSRYSDHEGYFRTIYMQMQTKLLENRDSICYLVDLADLECVDAPWTVVLGSHKLSHQNIRKIPYSQLVKMLAS